MEIKELPFEISPDELKSGIEADVLLSEPRSPGVHQSDIIRDLENIIIHPGKRKPDIEISDEDREVLNRYREMGFLWEVVLESVFKRRRIDGLPKGRYLRQVEIEHDKVFKTVDGIYIPQWRVLEYKLTFRSKNRATLDRFEHEFWAWFAQLKGNCLGHGTRLASLFVFWVCGTYHPPVPQPARYDIIFGEEELHDNWRMLKNHEAVMRKEGRLK